MYSRATTSAMADRVVVGFFVVLGAVLGVGILTAEHSGRLVCDSENEYWKARPTSSPSIEGQEPKGAVVGFGGGIVCEIAYS